MSRPLLLLDEDARFRRAALLIGGRIEALEIDVIGETAPRLDSIWRARVVDRLPAMNAAFVDLGGHPGFLSDAGDAKPGDVLPVQVRREAAEGKAARVTVMDGGAAPPPGAEGLIHEGPDAHERIRQHPDSAGAVEDCSDGCFDFHDAETQIEALMQPRIELGGGAWMQIEPAAALIAIDVNSGASRGGDARQRANLAAAAELDRQLRLRRLGGAIAVDFAGGPKGKARQRIEQRIGGGTQSLGWGPAGWLELRRRKLGRSLVEILSASPDIAPR